MDYEDTSEPSDESLKRILRNALNNPVIGLLREHHEAGDPLEFYVRDGAVMIVLR